MISAIIKQLSITSVETHSYQEPKEISIVCDEPWFTKIRNGEKHVEGRKNNEKYRTLYPGDTINFVSDKGAMFKAEVLKVEHYKDLYEYLDKVGYQKALPHSSVNSYADAVEVYKKFGNSDDQVATAGGFLGIFVKVIDPNYDY